jgi:hypothetical protein
VEGVGNHAHGQITTVNARFMDDRGAIRSLQI